MPTGWCSLPGKTSITRRLDIPTGRTDENAEPVDLYDDGSNESMDSVSGLDDKKIAENIRQYIRKPPRLIREEERGYVYIFRDEQRPGLLKIGSTKNEPKERESRLQSTCKLELFRVHDTGRQIENYKRAEQLVQRELKALKHNGRCRHCYRRHREWFEVGEDVAVPAVKRWTAFVQKMPWDSERNLKPFWDWWLNDILSDVDEKGRDYRQPLTDRLNLFTSPSIIVSVRYYLWCFSRERRSKVAKVSPWRWCMSNPWMVWAWILSCMASPLVSRSWGQLFVTGTLVFTTLSFLFDKF
jgi:hypothetical protein